MSSARQDVTSGKASRRWIVRQLARRLRYRTLDDLIGRTVILRSVDTILADVQAVLDDVHPACVFRGPEERFRHAALAKYGFLELDYASPPHLIPTEPPRGLSLLKELGFVGHVKNSHSVPLNADPLGFLEEMLKDMDKNRAVLKLFLEERALGWFPPPPEWEQWLQQPLLMPFPKNMRITDGCVTNFTSELVWIEKHLYL